MRRRALVVGFFGVAGRLAAQRKREPERRLPNGKSQRLAVLREDHEKSLRDVAEILELARALEQRLKADSQYVVSLESIRQSERIEKLARNIRNRLKRAQ